MFFLRLPSNTTKISYCVLCLCGSAVSEYKIPQGVIELISVANGAKRDNSRLKELLIRQTSSIDSYNLCNSLVTSPEMKSMERFNTYRRQAKRGQQMETNKIVCIVCETPPSAGRREGNHDENFSTW